MIQAMNAGEECFLTRPEWRNAERSPLEPSGYGYEETHLKHTLSKLLTDFPGMIRESASLVRSLAGKGVRPDDRSEVESAVCRQLQLKKTFESWFATLSLKTASAVDSDDGQPPLAEMRYRNLFCGIVDCIVN